MTTAGTDALERAVVDLAAALIAVPTANPPGDELRAAELVARYLDGAGLDVRIHPIGDGRANLIARLDGTGELAPLVFSGHLDTVPIGPEQWSAPPLGGEVRDGRLYGRGAADMKGAVAAMAVVVRELASAGAKPRGDLVLALTAGEEVDCAGARALIEGGLLDDAGLLVIGEPTGLDVGCAHKGLLWVRVRTEGRRGHGSVVGREDNAIQKLLGWLHPIEEIDALVDGEHPVLGRASVAVTQIDGGDAPNVVPGEAAAVLDIRTLPHHDHARLLAALGERGAAGLAVLRDGASVSTPPEAPLVAAAVDAVAEVLGRPAVVRGVPYLTDASVFVAGRELPTVILGPGHESQAHVVDEHVEVAALGQAARVYDGIARRLLLD